MPSKLLSGKLYFSFRETLKMIISAFSKRFSQKAGRAEDLLRNIVTGGTLFSELGFYYVGPIDGHALLEPLENSGKAQGDAPASQETGPSSNSCLNCGVAAQHRPKSNSK